MTELKAFQAALTEAEKAFKRSEVPIGAVIVKDGKIIARAFNSTEKKKSFLAHAELIAIQKACKKLGTKYLQNCHLYISLEPCQMCRTAAQLSRISSVHYLLKSKKFGKSGIAYHPLKIKKSRSVLSEQSRHLLSSFFESRRKPKTIEG